MFQAAYCGLSADLHRFVETITSVIDSTPSSRRACLQSHKQHERTHFLRAAARTGVKRVSPPSSRSSSVASPRGPSLSVANNVSGLMSTEPSGSPGSRGSHTTSSQPTSVASPRGPSLSVANNVSGPMSTEPSGSPGSRGSHPLVRERGFRVGAVADRD